MIATQMTATAQQIAYAEAVKEVQAARGCEAALARVEAALTTVHRFGAVYQAAEYEAAVAAYEAIVFESHASGMAAVRRLAA
jgi:hypothetical protein